MMISPESYYEEYLKGKTKEEIMTAIRGLKQEIGHLKNSMENPYNIMSPVSRHKIKNHNDTLGTLLKIIIRNGA
jgi:hypothetical protein